MTDQDFQDWIAEFEETLLCECGIDIADTGLTTDQLRKMTNQPGYLAAINYSQEKNITSKEGISNGR